MAGCNNTNATNFGVSATQDDGSCTFAAEGCTDETAYNFNQTWYVENGCSSAGACSDDGSCTERKCGCMDNSANNYDASANDAGSEECPVGTYECDYGGVDGCTSVTATNYNVNATNDDGSCTYDSNAVPGCTDSLRRTTTPMPPRTTARAVLPLDGCTTDTAYNYNANATNDDGSCTFLGCCADVRRELRWRVRLRLDDGQHRRPDSDQCISEVIEVHGLGVDQLRRWRRCRSRSSARTR